MASAKGLARVKPKMHMMVHLINSLSAAPGVTTRRVNPWSGCTWRDEDFIGKCMAMVKALHPKAVGQSFVERYCARLMFLLDV